RSFPASCAGARATGTSSAQSPTSPAPTRTASPGLSTAVRRPHDAAITGGSYGVDVPAMSYQLHEWDIHIVCRGADDAGGAGDAAAHNPQHQDGTFRRRRLEDGH